MVSINSETVDLETGLLSTTSAGVFSQTITLVEPKSDTFLLVEPVLKTIAHSSVPIWDLFSMLIALPILEKSGEPSLLQLISMERELGVEWIASNLLTSHPAQHPSSSSLRQMEKLLSSLTSPLDSVSPQLLLKTAPSVLMRSPLSSFQLQHSLLSELFTSHSDSLSQIL